MAEAKSSSRFEEKEADMDESSSECKETKGRDQDDDDYPDPGMTSDDEVEAEFRAMLKVKNEGEIAVSSDPATRKIAEGFKMYVVISSCIASDATTAFEAVANAVYVHMFIIIVLRVHNRFWNSETDFRFICARQL
jgi:hypothetical protein